MNIPIDSITIEPKRHRKVFDESKILDLANSIQANVLIHPLVVRPGPDKNFILMAGERRLRAVQSLQSRGIAVNDCELGYVPVTLFETLDPIAAKEIELEENLRRVDLSWQETALATAELHAMRKALHPDWTATATIAEIEERGGGTLSVTKVRDRTILAENLHRPEVAQATSEAQALKNLARMMEGEFRAALAKKEGTRESPHRLECVDALAGLDTVADSSVDVVITDPPYGIDAGDFGVETVTETHTYADDWESIEHLIRAAISKFGRVCKEQAHVYMFVDFSHWQDIAAMFEVADWTVWNRPLIWVKNTGYTPKPDYGPRRNYETIMFASRGKKMVTGVYSDVLTYNAVQKKEHAAQKPMDLYVDLLKRSTLPGSVILDPFCGSGVVFEAAKALNLRANGFDKDPAAFQIARGKL